MKKPKLTFIGYRCDWLGCIVTFRYGDTVYEYSVDRALIKRISRLAKFSVGSALNLSKQKGRLID